MGARSAFNTVIPAHEPYTPLERGASARGQSTGQRAKLQRSLTFASPQAGQRIQSMQQEAPGFGFQTSTPSRRPGDHAMAAGIDGTSPVDDDSSLAALDSARSKRPRSMHKHPSTTSRLYDSEASELTFQPSRACSHPSPVRPAQQLFGMFSPQKGAESVGSQRARQSVPQVPRFDEPNAGLEGNTPEPVDARRPLLSPVPYMRGRRIVSVKAAAPPPCCESESDDEEEYFENRADLVCQASLSHFITAAVVASSTSQHSGVTSLGAMAALAQDQAAAQQADRSELEELWVLAEAGGFNSGTEVAAEADSDQEGEPEVPTRASFAIPASPGVAAGLAAKAICDALMQAAAAQPVVAKRVCSFGEMVLAGQQLQARQAPRTLLERLWERICAGTLA
ncbi:hypothetical protein WJX72_007648 [[Myrmecia] bisecta]|uniref:Uncharacterized protein n=1 Tax=[Myrmecia] bisecta TaxID=41462 RepID=A0AAW1PX86_9CHLO